ncbi:MAG: hypothetical protein ACOC5J_00350 [Gemmatimonadota bacterium]
MPVALERLDAPTVRREAGDGFVPLLRCDACGKEIPKPAGGRVAWRPEENATYLAVAFLHEGCVETHRSQAGGQVEGYGKQVGGPLRVGSLESFLTSLGRFL